MNTEVDLPGPSIDSNNKNERIKARKLRIQERKDIQIRNAQLASQTDSAEQLMTVKEEMTQSRKQMEESYARLKRLHEEGFEMSTNIRVAGDLREVKRRVNDDEANYQRKDKIAMESKIAAEKFEEITMKWDVALKKNLAHELYQMLKEQKSACDAMLDEKNKLINECQTVLKEKDDDYVKELKRQAEDIDLLIERMQHQVKEMTLSYQAELELIEAAFIEERKEMLSEMNRRWNSMLAERRQKEMEYMKRREEKVEEYDAQLQQLRVADAEEFNRLKIQLENKIQMGQMELQHHKVLYQNNHERLEYNFQVVRKRDEESTITKALQKRKITKLHDIILKLNTKLEKEELHNQTLNHSLINDFCLINDQYKRLVIKSKCNMKLENDRFRQIFLMNDEECQLLTQKLISIDKCLAEQQLGLQWTPPDTSFFKNYGPIYVRKSRMKLSIKRSNIDNNMHNNNVEEEEQTKEFKEEEKKDEKEDEFYRDYYKKDRNMNIEDDDESESSHSSSYYREYYMNQTGKSTENNTSSKFSAETLRQIMELICDESGFLLEEKIRQLLDPLERHEKNLLKLDTILSVLDVNSNEDIEKLAQYFIQTKQESYDQEQNENQADNKSIVDFQLTIDKNKAGNTEDFPNWLDEETEMSENSSDHVPYSASTIRSLVEKSTEKIGDDVSEDSSQSSSVRNALFDNASTVAESDGSVTCQSRENAFQDHNMLIHPNDVLKALKAFVAENNNKEIGYFLSGHKSIMFANTKNEDHSTINKDENTSEEYTLNDVLKKYNLDKYVAQINFTSIDQNYENYIDYFGKYSQIIDQDKMTVWDTLAKNFEKYYQVLCSREKLLQDRESLCQQNTELKQLLNQYMNSKVTNELQVPPTQTMSFDNSYHY